MTLYERINSLREFGGATNCSRAEAAAIAADGDARIAAMHRSCENSKAIAQDLMDAVQELHNTIAARNTRIAELEDDADRLAWLARNHKDLPYPNEWPMNLADFRLMIDDERDHPRI